MAVFFKAPVVDLTGETLVDGFTAFSIVFTGPEMASANCPLVWMEWVFVIISEIRANKGNKFHMNKNKSTVVQLY